jgi:two-component system response regulator YesN
MQMAAIFALGMEANHLQEISVSYDDAVSKIEKSLILGTSIETQVLGSSFYPSVSYPDFLRHLEAEEKDKIQATIHTYFTEILASGDGENMDILKYYLIELVTYVLHSKYMVSFSETEITQKKQNAFSIISGTDSILQLEEKLNIFFLSLMEHAADASMEGSYSFMVQNALTYVNSNYTNDNLSLKTIAAEMEVNAAYLGREFARETGEFFNDYLNRIRIAKALHLLTTTTWKTAKVANSVGFVNISYFFTIFKKITGQSPGDYRATHV